MFYTLVVLHPLIVINSALSGNFSFPLKIFNFFIFFAFHCLFRKFTHKYISVPVHTKCLKPHLLYTKLFYISFENGYLMFSFNFPYMNMKHDVLLMNSVLLLYEIPPPMAQQPLVGQVLLIIDSSRSHSDTPHSARPPWPCSDCTIYKVEFIQLLAYGCRKGFTS